MNREVLYCTLISVGCLFGILGLSRTIARDSRSRAAILHESRAAIYANLGADISVNLRENPDARFRVNATKFQDGKSPNALVVLPASDYNNAFNGDSQTLARSKIEDHYDTKFIIADTEDDILQWNDATSIDLLVLSGHGSPTSISLGERDPSTSSGLDETKTIDLSDGDLIYRITQILSPHATIVLDSCLTGEGGKTTPNLANMVAKISGRRVVAATDIVTRIEVDTDCPSKIRLFNGNTDVTYVVEKGKPYKHILKGRKEYDI